MPEQLASGEVSFSSTEAVRLSGLTYRQVNYALERALFEPMVPSRGTGTRRRFSQVDIDKLKMLKVLRDEGVGDEVVRRVLDLDDYKWRWLVVKSGKVVLVATDAVLLGLLAENLVTLVVRRP